MEELLKKFNELRKQKKWVEAAEVQMVLDDEYPNAKFDFVDWQMYDNEQSLDLEKRAETDRKVAYLLGRLKFINSKEEESYMWSSRAAAAGHVRSICWKGELLWYGYGVQKDLEAALKCFEEAGAAGYKYACYKAGIVHELNNRFFLAALWYQRGKEYCKLSLELLKRMHLIETCPWGVWRPDKEYHSLVHPKVQEAVKTTLLLFKRAGITRYIAWQVCAYVVTRSGWFNL